MNKLLLSAAVLAGALALSGVAMADTSANANGGGGSAVAVGVNGNSHNLNGNGSHDGNDTGNQANANNNSTNSSHNGNDTGNNQSLNFTNQAQHNGNDTGNNQSKTLTADNGNTSDFLSPNNNTTNLGSNDHNGDTSDFLSPNNNTSNVDLTDNSQHNGHNTTTTTTLTFSGPVSANVLTSSVSDVSLPSNSSQSTGQAQMNGTGNNGASFAGMQTVAQNTGNQSGVNAATSVAATANITFGASTSSSGAVN